MTIDYLLLCLRYWRSIFKIKNFLFLYAVPGGVGLWPHEQDWRCSWSEKTSQGYSLILHIRQSVALKLNACDNLPLWTSTFKGQGYPRERGNQWSVQGCWDLAPWVSGVPVQWPSLSIWGSKGEVPAASFPILSSIKLVIFSLFAKQASLAVFPKMIWVCTWSCNIPQSQYHPPAKPLREKLFHVRSWWQNLCRYRFDFDYFPRRSCCSRKIYSHITFYNFKWIFFQDLHLTCSCLLPDFIIPSTLIPF